MTDEWIQMKSLSNFKERAQKHRGETKYEWKEFKFKKSGSDSKETTISPNNHCEFLVIYKGNHIETFSIDIMSVDRIREKLDDIRKQDPESMKEWLNK